MSTISQNIQKYSNLFVPSGVGMVLYTFFSGLIIILNQFEAIKRYLQLPEDFQYVSIVTAWLDRTLTSLLGQGRTEVFVVGLFWAAVGLGVYLILSGIARFLSELSEGLDERRYMWPIGSDRNIRFKEAVERIIFRVAACVGLIAVVFGPLARLVGGPAGDRPSSPLQFLMWFAALWLVLHVLVILLRLMALRPRLFN